MNKKQKIALLGLGITLGIGVSTAGYVSAAETETSFPPMIQRIIEKYNLNKDEVQGFLEENRTEIQAEKRAERTEELYSKLQENVEKGTITQEQYEMIIKRHEEIKETRTGEYQNRGKIRGRQDGLKAYLEEQGIDSSILPEKEGFGRKNNRGAGVHRSQ